MNRKQRMLFLTLAIGIGGIALAVAAYFGLRIPCLFHLLTGLNCPGCGNTRAVVCLLRLDFAGMFHYNLMLLPQLGYLIYVYAVCVRNYIKGGAFSYGGKTRLWDVLFLVVLLVWTVVRNLTPLF